MATGGLLEEFKKLQKEQKERREESDVVHVKVDEVPNGGAASVLVNEEFITVTLFFFIRTSKNGLRLSCS